MRMRIGAMAVVAATLACAQQPVEPLAVRPEVRAPFILAPNDRLLISAAEVEGLDDTLYRIDADGTVDLPLLGKIRAEGFTIEQFEKDLTGRFAAYVRSPRVSVRRMVERTDTVVVTGAFKNPGVYPLSERRTLVDVISAVGGTQPNARIIKITRRLERGQEPLAAGTVDSAARPGVLTVNLARLMAEPTLQENVLVEPQDVLLAETAGVAFVTGEVLKPGAFELGERDSFTVTELISLAGGLARGAAPQKAKVLRPVLDGSRRAEISLDAKGVLDGRATDFRILPNDIVVIPRSGGKLRAIRTALLYAAPAVLTSLIYLAFQ